MNGHVLKWKEPKKIIGMKAFLLLSSGVVNRVSIPNWMEIIKVHKPALNLSVRFFFKHWVRHQKGRFQRTWTTLPDHSRGRFVSLPFGVGITEQNTLTRLIRKICPDFVNSKKRVLQSSKRFQNSKNTASQIKKLLKKENSSEEIVKVEIAPKA